MDKAELRKAVHTELATYFGKVGSLDATAAAAIAIVGQACAEIAETEIKHYMTALVGENRRLQCAKLVAARDAAMRVQAVILAMTQETPDA